MEVIAKKLTYPEFREWEYDDDDPFLYELIDGQLVPRKTPDVRHQIILGNVMRVLDDFVRNTKTGVVFHALLDVVFDDFTALQPDILFIKKERSFLSEKEIAVFGAPDLIVEILSKETAFRDKSIKKDIYEMYGVREYWLVDPLSKSIDIYAFDQQRFKLMQYAVESGSMKSIILEGLEFNLEDIFQADFLS